MADKLGSNGKKPIIRANETIKSTHFEPRNPPPANVLQIAFSSWEKQTQRSSVVLSCDPAQLIAGLACFRTNKVCNVAGNAEATASDIVAYLAQFGGLIITNDPDRRYIFDKEQCYRVVNAARRDQRPNNPNENQRQQRLYQLLGETMPEELLVSPSTAKKEARDARNKIEQTLSTQLTDMLAEFPTLASLIRQISQLSQVAWERKDDAAIGFVLTAIGLDIRDLKERISDSVLELLSSISEPEQPTSVSPPRIEATPLETGALSIAEMMRKVAVLLQPLTRKKQEAEEKLREAEDSAAQLEEQLRFASQAETPGLTNQLKSARQSIRALEDYINRLLEYEEPLKNCQRQLLARKAALDTLTKPLPALDAGTAEILPPFLELDVADLQPAKSSAEFSTGDKQAATGACPRPVPTAIDLNALNAMEKTIIAVLSVSGGRRTAGKISSLIHKTLGICFDESDRGYRATAQHIFDTLKSLEERGIVAYHGYAGHKLLVPLSDEFISDSLSPTQIMLIKVALAEKK